MPAIRACLEHRHSYVRRNAVLAIYTIYRFVTAKILNFVTTFIWNKQEMLYWILISTTCLLVLVSVVTGIVMADRPPFNGTR